MDALLEKTGVVPVVVIEDAGHAITLAQALLEGGLPIIEVTLRTEAAAEAIELIAKNVPETVIGAGTVLNVDQFKLAHNAGAQFVVSPGLHLPVVEAAQSQNLPIYPGIATASELQAAFDMGLKTVKFFPAELAGGVPMLKALGSVFRGMKFMPTGGVSPDNLSDYLSLPAVSACGGSWLSPSGLIANQEFVSITRLAAEAKTIVTSVKA